MLILTVTLNHLHFLDPNFSDLTFDPELITAMLTGWTPTNKKELQDAIMEWCRRQRPECSKGPHGPIGSWDVSKVADMKGMFAEDTYFNAEL